MPDLIVIVGPPAAGKAAVGHALCELAGFRLFHNHLTAEPVAASFGWGTPAYLETIAATRLALLTRALAEPASASIVFTYVWAFDLLSDGLFMADLKALFESRGQRVFWVELVASLAARLAREGTALRLALKPAKRDVDGARALHSHFDARFQMNSKGRFPYPDRYVAIDTEQHVPAAAARIIAERFGFASTTASAGPTRR